MSSDRPLNNSTQSIKLWILLGDKPIEVQRSMIPLEEKLEKWIEEDISIVSDNLLLISRQEPTTHTGNVDILCMDADANLVIIELKRDKTPREVTAQTIDYATWASQLNADKVVEIAESYYQRIGNNISLADAFKDKFGTDLPTSINEDHSMIIVGSNIDSRTQRIIGYLNDRGIGINAYTVNHFQDNEQAYIAGTYLVEPEKAEKSRTKRTKVSTKWTQLLDEIANHFKVINPKARFGKTGSAHKAIFTPFARIHFEWLIMGPQNEKSVYCALHFEKDNRDENIQLYNQVVPFIEDFDRKHECKGYHGLRNPKYPNHKWRTISYSRELSDKIENDIEWAVNFMVKMYDYYLPILSQIM